MPLGKDNGSDNKKIKRRMLHSVLLLNLKQPTKEIDNF